MTISALQNQPSQIVGLDRGVQSVLGGGEAQLLIGALDAGDQDAVLVQRDGAVIAADDLRGNDRAVRRLGVDDQVMAALLRRVAGEAGVAGDVLQRAGDLLRTDEDAALEIADGFTEKIGACRDIGVLRQAYVGFATTLAKAVGSRMAQPMYASARRYTWLWPCRSPASASLSGLPYSMTFSGISAA